MKIKKFEATSMKEALEKIKAEMGPDAFILSTKQINKKGPLGFGDRKFLQVTAAIEENEADKVEDINLNEKDDAWHLIDDGGDEKAEIPSYDALGRAAKTTEPPPRANKSFGGAGSPFTAGFEAVFSEARAAVAEEEGKSSDESSGRPLRQEISEIKNLVRDLGTQSPDISPIQRDLSELKGLLYNVIRNQTPFGNKNLSPTLFGFFQKLKDSGMDESVAAKLIQIVDEKMDEKYKDNSNKIVRYLISIIANSIDVSKQSGLDPGKPKIIALIGPTGVGKTTTLAKLAAWYKIQENASVALITLDSYRIAAVDQLKSFANIMELPLQVALSIHELRQAIQYHQDKSLILIDSAGQSPRDEERMKNLLEFFNEEAGIDIHLVLSATTKAADLSDIVSRFGVLKPNHLILTKLDETRSYGSLFTQIVKTKLPVSFVTMGQSVPEDFEFATRELLAGLFVGQGLEVLKGEEG